MDLALEPARVLLDLAGDPVDAHQVELDPGALHLQEHVHQRQLDVAEEAREPLLLHHLALVLCERARDDGRRCEPVGALDLGREARVLGKLLQVVVAA